MVIKFHGKVIPKVISMNCNLELKIQIVTNLIRAKYFTIHYLSILYTIFFTSAQIAVALVPEFGKSYFQVRIRLLYLKKTKAEDN